MGLTKLDIIDCYHDINDYFNEKYLHISPVANRVDTDHSTHDAIMISFHIFDGYVDKNKLRYEPLGLIINWINEHIKPIINKYNIPELRIIYKTGTLRQLLYDGTKTIRDDIPDYVVYQGNFCGEYTYATITDYIKNLPKI